MALLQDIRGIFTRKKPVVIDLTSSQASGLASGPDTHIEAKPLVRPNISGRAPAPEGDPEDRADRKSISARARVPAAPNVEEVMIVVRQISTHLETQARRTDKLIECMERLPGALDALPEINRQNSRLLEIVNEYLGHARRRDDALNETLSGITDASARQTEVLGLIQQQMDENTRSSQELRSGLVDFKDAISQLAGTNRRTTSVLSEMNQTNDRREQELTRMLRRSQAWMIGAMICSAAATATAVAVAGVVVFRVL